MCWPRAPPVPQLVNISDTWLGIALDTHWQVPSSCSSPQARFLLAKLNPSATYNTSSAVSSEIIMTDDVSLQVTQPASWSERYSPVPLLPGGCLLAAAGALLVPCNVPWTNRAASTLTQLPAMSAVFVQVGRDHLKKLTVHSCLTPQPTNQPTHSRTRPCPPHPGVHGSPQEAGGAELTGGAARGGGTGGRARLAALAGPLPARCSNATGRWGHSAQLTVHRRGGGRWPAGLPSAGA